MPDKFSTKIQYHDRAELIENHIQRFFENAEVWVYHETPTIDFHLDIFFVKPADTEFDLLLTGGMSLMEMNVSEIRGNSDDYKFAEVMVLIPKGMNFGQMYPGGTPNDWIITMLKQVARFPHYYDTWVGIGHTLQATEEMDPYSSDTSFCGCLVLPTVTFSENFRKIGCPEGHINIYSLFPLYKEELKFKIENGFIKFAQLLSGNNAQEVLDLNRKKILRT